MKSYKKTILVPDHNNPYMMLIYIRLRKMGFNVIPYMGLEDMLAKAVANSAEMIFLDIGITGMDCVEALKALRADERTAGLPSVVISADPSEEKREECLALGAESFMMWPIDVREMHEVLQRCLYLPMGYYRDNLRVCFSGRVLVSHGGLGEWLYSETLSEKGIYIRKKYPYAVGTEVVVSIPLFEERSISLDGRVVYVNRSDSTDTSDPSGMAIEFSNRDMNALVVISDYVMGLLMIPAVAGLQGGGVSCGS